MHRSAPEFYCPWSDDCSLQACGLRVGDAGAECESCGIVLPIAGGILQFVAATGLDSDKQRELDGNTLALDRETVELYLHKDEWTPLLTHWSNRSLRRLAKFINSVAPAELTFLGVGTGFEVPPLLKYGVTPQRLNLSDLSATALTIAQIRMAGHADLLPGPPYYFTADLDAVPLRNREQGLVIYECLHHTSDMHAALERMLAVGYADIFFVEPTTNWLIRALARRGVAQRIEYSGVDPDRLDIGRVRELARKYGYTTRIRTEWAIPIDYVAAAARKLHLPRRAVDRSVLAACGALGALGRPFHFGNFTVCALHRKAVCPTGVVAP